MGCRFAAHITFSFDTFARRGGGLGPHGDGWGVAFFDGRDVQLVREPFAAATSATVRFLQEHPLASTFVISHIRRATHGQNGLRNTQPLARELGGRIHVFAHNGHVPGAISDPRMALDGFRPVGDTDSEHAFCALLARLAPLWRDAPGDTLHSVAGPPSLSRRHDVISAFARDLGRHGPANFVYSDGDVLFAHGHRRTQADGQIRPPGLHVLCRSCQEAPAASPVVVTSGAGHEQRVVLFASVPLTDEPWRPLAEGELMMVREGTIIDASSSALPPPSLRSPLPRQRLMPRRG